MPMPPPQQLVQDASGRAHAVDYATAGVILTGVAGLIHLWVAPEHFQESWVVGTFFVVAGIGQLAFGVALVRGLGTRGLLVGVAANAGLVCLYVLSRTVALPFLPAHDEGHVEHLPVAGAAGNGVPIFPHSSIESVGLLDMTCLLAELALLVMLVALLPTNPRRVTANTLMGLGLLAVAARAVGVLG